MDILTTTKFQVVVLSELDGDDKISAALSPMMAAEQIVESGLCTPFHTLVRINTDDPAYNNFREEGYWTGHDTLAVISGNSSRRMICLFIDEGVRICPICIWFSDDPLSEKTMAQPYKEAKFGKKFSEDLLDEILTELSTTITKGLEDIYA